VIATAVPLSAGLAVEQAKYGGEIKVTAQGSIKSMDPTFSPAYVTYAVATHVWEAPLAHDADYVTQPLMLDSYSTSDDGLTWTFTLRDNLTFSNGTEITTDHVLASWPRWAEGSAGGRFVADQLKEGGLNAQDKRTWTLETTVPFGGVAEAIGWTYKTWFIFDEGMSSVPHNMDAGEGQLDNLIGSGPYKLGEWDVGNKISMVRNELYVPRTEEGSFLAGGRIPYVDKVTWFEIPSEETKIAGLKTGEWDLVDGAGLDYFEPMKAHPGINVGQYWYHKSFLGVSHNDWPTDQEKVRQAIMISLDWKEMMAGLGPSDLWYLCPAIYYCNTPWETDIGASEWYNQSDIPRAKALLEEAGYDGAPVEIMNPQDYATIAPLGPVLQARLEDIGMTTSMPGMDWSTLVSKIRQIGQFNLFTCWSTYTDPFNDLVATAGGRGYAGGYTYQDMIDARINFAFAATYQEKMKYAEELQMLYFQHVPRIYGGQFSSIFPYASRLKNMSIPKYPVFTGVWLEN
jgi:peptide/nickel transport system substrate-binding protein